MKYSGIGSRQAPGIECERMARIAQILAARKHILRSGGADGADKAFETGHRRINDDMEIFIPWRKFVTVLEPFHILNIPKKTELEAAKIAESIHPAWDRCSAGAKKLHTRNVYQVLGVTLDEPSEFLIAWTIDGLPTGGSRTAIVLAQKNNVPVFNLNHGDLKTATAMQAVQKIAQGITGRL